MDPYLAPLMQYGVLGIFAVLLVLFARTLLKREQERSDGVSESSKALLKREQDRADLEHTENVRLNTLIQEQTIPALVKATDAMLASYRLLEGIQRDREIQNAVFEHNKKTQTKPNA